MLSQKRDWKKGLCILAVLLAACLCFGGCAERRSTHTSSIQSEADAEKSSHGGNSASIEESAEASGEQEQYETYVAQLGYLLNSSGWETAADLSPTDYVMWYGYRMRDLPSSDRYRIEGRDGFFFPAEEFESQVTSCFDVPVAHLRSDPVVYLEAEHLYRTPAALMPLAESSYEITSVTENSTTIQVEFTLDFVEFNRSKEMTLRLEKTADSIRYLSYYSERKYEVLQ